MKDIFWGFRIPISRTLNHIWFQIERVHQPNWARTSDIIQQSVEKVPSSIPPVLHRYKHQSSSIKSKTAAEKEQATKYIKQYGNLRIHEGVVHGRFDEWDGHTCGGLGRYLQWIEQHIKLRIDQPITEYYSTLWFITPMWDNISFSISSRGSHTLSFEFDSLELCRMLLPDLQQ